jgi:hypothetical protein
LLCGLDELAFLLERGADLKGFLRAKVEAAALDKQPLFRPPVD